MIRKILAISLLATMAVGGFLCYKNLQRGRVASPDNKITDPLKELVSLPYASWSPEQVEDERVGVVRYDETRVSGGYNLYTDDEQYAFLIHPSGRIAHKWKFPEKCKWEYSELLYHGEIVAICVGRYFIKLDRDSNVIWQKRIAVHHEIEILQDGTFLVPGFSTPVIYKRRLVQYGAINHLSNSGEKIDQWKISENVDKLRSLHQKRKLDLLPTERQKRPDSPGGKRAVYDYYHLNSIQSLPATKLGEVDKRFRKGNLLISLRNANLLVILDKDSKEPVWSWGPGILDWPHTPLMLRNGNILIFDNGAHRNYSRVIEVDPLKGAILWEYQGDPPESFHSRWEGSSQRLSNGNTLICESRSGRVFEVTPAKEIVWEFFSPRIDKKRRGLIYRMMRIEDGKKLAFLGDSD